MSRSKNAPASVHEEKVTGRIFEWQVYRRLFPFARPYSKRFAASVVMLLLLAGLAMVGPLAIRAAMDRYIAPGTTNLTDADRVQGLLGITGFLLGAGLLTFLVRYAQLWLANDTGQRIIYDLRTHVFEHIQSRNLRFFDTNPVGKLVTRVTSDVETLAELFSAGVDVIFYDIVMISLILGVLFWIDPTLAACTLALLPFMAGWSFYFKREAQQLFRNVRAKVTQLNSLINESVTGIRVIQMYRAEQRTTRRFREWNDELKRAHLGTVRNFSFFFPGIEVFQSLGNAVILLVGYHLVGGGELSAGGMLAFWFLMHRFFEPLRQISEKYNLLQAAMASSERIIAILDTDMVIADKTTPVALAAKDEPPRICFENVTFSYDGTTDVLRDISFDVAPGERLAIVGATGAGKTSLINVLSRFYDIREGRVTLDGTDLRDIDKQKLRRRVGVVLQDVFLFADDVRENIRLGNDAISDERILEACRTVHADRLVQRLSDGLDHEVQERGATFSMGERQLLAFARTLVHDPPILVLDEATSNIDTETEMLIQRALDRLMEGRTVLVIAHRLSTIQKADRILVMHQGRIHETGTHAELLKKDGLYRRLYELQYARRSA